jgi:hypothetical protein
VTECYFKRFDWGPCDGRVDPCHLIPKQRIKETYKRRGEVCPDLWVPALIVPGCRHHHGIFDRKMRKLRRRHFPATLLEWALAHGFYWDPERSEWRGRAAVPETKESA